ncbi:hypothetical protein, partial [Streptomyces roseiscleroticus]|uniref:hypothetical protein n=1 Tax=Streptomyces roseiscleroticus TaxID=1972 RepID=UPI003D157654
MGAPTRRLSPPNRSDGTRRKSPDRQPHRPTDRDHGSPPLAMPPSVFRNSTATTTKHIFVTGGVASSLG